MGWLPSNLVNEEACADMTNYEKVMLCIAILTLLIDALALLNFFL